MPTNIEMPKLSDTMTEGTLVKWNKQVGDTIEIGDVIAEVETDKATMEMEAFDEGILSDILVQAGEKAAVGATLGVLLEDGEEAPAPGSAPAAISAPESQPFAEGAEAAQGAEAGEASQPAAELAAPAAQQAGPGERIKASPLARKIADSKGVNIAAIQGSGPGGRIVKADVEAAAEGGNAPSRLASAATALAASAKAQVVQSTPAAVSAPAPAVAINPVVAAGDQTIELSSMRRIIADRLLTSKTTIPHFYLHVECDTAPLMTLRKQINAQAEQTHGNKYSINDFV